MRIQHNIMAMNAYRNYNNNTKALSGNLEKLSSGYKINRAGDDAAGLAISEKMRAQITGLDAAQKNVKDGISLVKTAEGAMQEIQDMLNRMKYLATQSANGTYDDAVDRKNLQKEVVSLTAEIDRIAKSANFNGIALLDGSLDGTVAPESLSNQSEVMALDEGFAVTQADLVPDTEKSIKDVQGSISGDKTDFEKINFKDESTAVGTAGMDGKSITVKFTSGSKTVTVNISFAKATSSSSVTASTAGFSHVSGNNYKITIGSQATASAIQGAIDGAFGDKSTKDTANGTVGGYGLGNVSLDVDSSGKMSFKADISVYKAAPPTGAKTEVPQNTSIKVDMTQVSQASKSTVFASGTKMKVGQMYYQFTTAATGISAQALGDSDNPIKVKIGANNDETMKNLAEAITRQSATTGIKATYDTATKEFALTSTQKFASTDDFKDAATVSFEDAISDPTLKQTMTKAFSDALTSKINELENGGGGGGMKGALTLQIGDTSADYNQLQVNIKSMKTTDFMGQDFTMTTDPVTGVTKYDATGGVTISKINIASQADAAAAIDTIKNAINFVSSVRGDLGALQNRLDHTANNLSVMAENIQDAESTIRDTDVADEMMKYVKNNILVQSAQAMLAQANQVPQGVLQLLG